MADDELGRRLGDAFDAQARAAVPDHRPAPPWSVEPLGTLAHRHRFTRRLAPLAAAAAVAAVVIGATLLAQGSGSHHHVTAGGSASTPNAAAPSSPIPVSPASSPAKAPSSTAMKPPHPAAAVRVRLNLSGGEQVGIGMPVIASFSRPITSGQSLANATRVTVNGHPVVTAWYFVANGGSPGLQGHLRMQHYWPAHASIRVRIAVRGASAGAGLAFANDVSVSFRTGAANIAVVDGQTNRLRLMSDRRTIANFPVSLGRPATPTLDGTKVIMEKGVNVCMSGPGYDVCGVKYTQRLTYGGEYLHAAPWNARNIKHGVDSSNGCTNLLQPDARRLFQLLEPGDVVQYEHTDGPKMTIQDGYGDWNVPWPVWLTGGALRLG